MANRAKGWRVAATTVMLLASACLVTPTEPVQMTDETRELFHFQRSGNDEVFGFQTHGFLVDREDAYPVALTAYHVAGPFVHSAPGTTTAWLRSPVLPIAKVRLGPRLPIAGARVIGGGDSQHDIAAFRVIDWKPSRALRLADAVPAVGETVFVLAVHHGDPNNPHPLSGPRRHRARVEISTDSAFVYSYLDSKNANFTSGAAVLDGEGRLVGLNVGTSSTTSGDVLGFAVGLTAIRHHLRPLR